MTDQATSPLRRRMIEDMTIRNLSPRTQEGYIRTVKRFAAFLGGPSAPPSLRLAPLQHSTGSGQIGDGFQVPHDHHVFCRGPYLASLRKLSQVNAVERPPIQSLDD
jgi:Phage integrase, N-terminal SAM-like domain